MLATRQTFQQWMVLSALVLLLLPGLLCHAASMDPGASSSSGAHYSASDAERNAENIRLQNQIHHGANSGKTIPRFKTLEYILVHRHGFSIASLPRTPADQLGYKYAHILHFEGVPVLDVRNTEVYDLQQALVDYDHVYVYGNKRGARQESVIKVFAHQTPIDPAPQSSAILQKVTASRCFEKTWGSKLGAHEADEKGAMPRSVAALAS
ncbi:hypothetical protein NDA13_005464 [Ustilago tritici]|nr:hypothetical protein NDA13_005464 [Ustilago tritici]